MLRERSPTPEPSVNAGAEVFGVDSAAPGPPVREFVSRAVRTSLERPASPHRGDWHLGRSGADRGQRPGSETVDRSDELAEFEIIDTA